MGGQRSSCSGKLKRSADQLIIYLEKPGNVQNTTSLLMDVSVSRMGGGGGVLLSRARDRDGEIHACKPERQAVVALQVVPGRRQLRHSQDAG